MRIIGGDMRGRPIHAPVGLVSRPTTDRVRESLFNILSSMAETQLSGARVIDLFAGSGALGIEALSRGAAQCLFVESDAQARGAIRDNIERLNLIGKTSLHRRSAISLGKRPASAGDTFSLAFLDPPYGNDLVPQALKSLTAGDWLSPGAIAVAETQADETLDPPPAFEELDSRRYGNSKLWFLRFADA